jgi:polysaccharide deacetylase 2 family uncharacterized protein YibQ
MRGFFGGLFIGLVMIVAVLVGLSLLSPAARSPDLAVETPQASGSDDQNGADAGIKPGGTDADLVELPPTAPGSGETASDTLSALDATDTQPSDKPSVGGATTGLSGLGAAPTEAGVAVNSDAPVAPASSTEAPDAPQGDNQPVAVANPAQPTLPDVSQTGSGFGTGIGSGPETDEVSPVVAMSTDSAPASGDTTAQATAPGAEAAPDPSTTSAIAPVVTDAADSSVVPVPQVAQDAPQEPAAPSVPEAGQTETTTAPQIAALPQTGAEPDTSRSRIGTQVVPLTERDIVVTETDEPTATMESPAGPPIEIYSVSFDNPDAKPVMAIVLIDDEGSIGVEALVEFPYPITFAVDPSAPGAADKMARHRAAGFEVVAMVDLPSVATAQDAEVTLAVWLDAMPEVVAVLEGTGSGIQGNRALSDQVTAIAGQAGLGLIMQVKGLNTAQKLAARDGVPSALVFRDFDGAEQSPIVIRRFLDQAAFRAGQQGGVIMLGRVRPDTISALLLWGLQDRISRVALAPVSAVLTRAP